MQFQYSWNAMYDATLGIIWLSRWCFFSYLGNLQMGVGFPAQLISLLLKCFSGIIRVQQESSEEWKSFVMLDTAGKHIWILLKPVNLDFHHFSYDLCASSSTLRFKSILRLQTGHRNRREQETKPAPISFSFLARIVLQWKALQRLQKRGQEEMSF